MFSLVTRSSRVGPGQRGRASDGALGTPREPEGHIRAKMLKELGMLVNPGRIFKDPVEFSLQTKETNSTRQ